MPKSDNQGIRQATKEIQTMTVMTRYHLQHVTRNHMQIIAGLSEERTDNLLPLPVRERLKAINEAVQTMSEDMRRLGL